MPDGWNPGLLEPEEVKLLWLIRHRFQYSEVTIKIRGGKPYYIERRIEGVQLRDR